MNAHAPATCSNYAVRDAADPSQANCVDTTLGPFQAQPVRATATIGTLASGGLALALLGALGCSDDESTGRGAPTPPSSNDETDTGRQSSDTQPSATDTEDAATSDSTSSDAPANEATADEAKDTTTNSDDNTTDSTAADDETAPDSATDDATTDTNPEAPDDSSTSEAPGDTSQSETRDQSASDDVAQDDAANDPTDDAQTDDAPDTDTPTDDPPPETGVAIRGRQVFVDGQPLHIRGVNWNPIPVGQGHPDGLDYAGYASTDIPLMQVANINVVRTYEPLLDSSVLDQLHAAGIHAMITVYPYGGQSPSEVTARVNAVKDHPAVLAWVIGNEWNYNGIYVGLSIPEARDLLNEVAATIKAADTSHPVTSIWGGTGELEETVNQMPDVDVWGINYYGGLDFGDVFSTWEQISDKPMYLGEYGADAYNANTNSYDPESQREAAVALTQLLLDNSTALSDGVTLGGCIFEWADEWWKAEGSAAEQDTGGIAPGGGPHPDNTFNEEYWGIVDIDRNPRPAYEALSELYEGL